MKKIKFDAHSHFIPEYCCNQSGDYTGYYYRADEVDMLFDKILEAINATTAEILREAMKGAK